MSGRVSALDETRLIFDQGSNKLWTSSPSSHFVEQAYDTVLQTSPIIAHSHVARLPYYQTDEGLPSHIYPLALTLRGPSRIAFDQWP